MPRLPFTDGANSFWHLVFGAAAIWAPIIIAFFLIYQLNQGTANDAIDVVEFLVGYAITCVALQDGALPLPGL
jgi:hypothetical protein